MAINRLRLISLDYINQLSLNGSKAIKNEDNNNTYLFQIHNQGKLLLTNF